MINKLTSNCLTASSNCPLAKLKVFISPSSSSSSSSSSAPPTLSPEVDE